MRCVPALLAALLLCIPATAAAGPDAPSTEAQTAQQQPRRPLRPPPPPPVERRRPPPPVGASTARPPPPRPAPFVLVPVRLSGYTDRQQAAKAAKVLSGLVRTLTDSWAARLFAANRRPLRHS